MGQLVSVDRKGKHNMVYCEKMVGNFQEISRIRWTATVQLIDDHHQGKTTFRFRDGARRILKRASETY